MKLVLVFILVFITNYSFSQKEFVVFFDSNTEVPNKESLSQFNVFLNSKLDGEIISISGYCDSSDSNDYNKKLATRRINSVLKLLKENSFSLHKNIEINSIGEDFELAKKQSENRKVVIKYKEVESKLVLKENEDELKNDSVALVKDTIEKERISLAEKFQSVKVGDRVPIYNIHFQFNSEKLVSDSESLLEELLMIMEKNPKMSIKIHGHICCNPNPYNTKLSYRRALKIFNYLKMNGIQQNRLAYNGVGSNNPIYEIPERNEQERIINRRVEIEIIRK